MKVISHRGNLEGPSSLENHPDQINRVLDIGFDCEVDLWYEEGSLLLGHDSPEYIVNKNFLEQDGLWIHSKNLEALGYCSGGLNYFWHESDSYALTSKQFIWTFPNKPVVDKSVIVDNSRHWRLKGYNCFGVCSDYIL